MTNEEAIKIIEVAKAEIEWNYPLEYQVALDKAIEALKHDVPDIDVGEMVSRQAAIAKAEKESNADGAYGYMDTKSIVELLEELPSAETKQSTDIQDILQFLDERLHPIVSPEHWNVYSELHDMISCLLSEEPQRKTGRWLKISPAGIYECSECGKNVMTADIDAYEFCHGCGSQMEVEKNVIQ